MLEGRWLSSNRSASEVVINETLAKERFGRQSPVGQLLDVDVGGGKDPKPFSVVGVVADVRPGIRQTADARIYFPQWLQPGTIDTLVLRLDRQPASDFARLVRRSVYVAEPRLFIFAILSIDEGIKDETWAERHAYTMLKGLAAVALVLTAVGLFSVISVMVDSRMQEFGVRMAVGATSGDLRRMVIRRGLVAALLGILIGIGGAIALTRFMRSLLFETEAFDPAVYIAVAAVLLVVSVLACLLPARRASRVDVLQLLRSN
jgi:putative ABC transport system permease protein